MTISERIRLTRQQKDMSQKALAEIAGVNLKSLSRYELGTSIPPADVIKKLADALKVSTDTLLSDEKINIQDKDLLRKFEVIQNMKGETKKTVINLIDLAIRDFKAKQAYAS
jgi:transcriptional regulator with XRE-family HTH domain